MLRVVDTGDGDSDIRRWFGIQNNAECGGPARFCGEQIAGSVSVGALLNDEARHRYRMS